MLLENLMTIGFAAAMLLGAFLVGRLIRRKNSWPVAILLAFVMMAVLNRVLQGMGYWYYGNNEPEIVQAAWYALHVPVALYIRSAPSAKAMAHGA